MSDDFYKHPILNSPYAYPSRHWELDDDGASVRVRLRSRTPRPAGGKDTPPMLKVHVDPANLQDE